MSLWDRSSSSPDAEEINPDDTDGVDLSDVTAELLALVDSEDIDQANQNGNVKNLEQNSSNARGKDSNDSPVKDSLSRSSLIEYLTVKTKLRHYCEKMGYSVEAFAFHVSLPDWNIENAATFLSYHATQAEPKVQCLRLKKQRCDHPQEESPTLAKDVAELELIKIELGKYCDRLGFSAEEYISLLKALRIFPESNSRTFGNIEPHNCLCDIDSPEAGLWDYCKFCGFSFIDHNPREIPEPPPQLQDAHARGAGDTYGHPSSSQSYQSCNPSPRSYHSCSSSIGKSSPRSHQSCALSQERGSPQSYRSCNQSLKSSPRPKLYCNYCREMGFPSEYYSSHVEKLQDGEIVCPELRKFDKNYPPLK